jgi:hypothetical protein
MYLCREESIEVSAQRSSGMSLAGTGNCHVDEQQGLISLQDRRRQIMNNAPGRMDVTLCENYSVVSPHSEARMLGHIHFFESIYPCSTHFDFDVVWCSVSGEVHSGDTLNLLQQL